MARKSVRTVIREVSLNSNVTANPTDGIPEHPAPTDVVITRDYHAFIVVALFLFVLFGVLYLIYRCTELGCHVFG